VKDKKIYKDNIYIAKKTTILIAIIVIGILFVSSFAYFRLYIITRI